MDYTCGRIIGEPKEDTKGIRKFLNGMSKSMIRSKEPDMHTVLNKEGGAKMEEIFRRILNVKEGELIIKEIPSRERQEHIEI